MDDGINQYMSRGKPSGQSSGYMTSDDEDEQKGHSRFDEPNLGQRKSRSKYRRNSRDNSPSGSDYRYPNKERLNDKKGQRFHNQHDINVDERKRDRKYRGSYDSRDSSPIPQNSYKRHHGGRPYVKETSDSEDRHSRRSGKGNYSPEHRRHYSSSSEDERLSHKSVTSGRARPKERQHRQRSPESLERKPRQRSPESLERKPCQRSPEPLERKPRQRSPESLERKSRQRSPESLERKPRQRSPESLERKPRQRSPESLERKPRQRSPESLERKPCQRSPESLERNPRQRTPKLSGRKYRLGSPKSLEMNYRQRSPEVSERSYCERSPEFEKKYRQRSPEFEKKYRQRSPEVSERSYRQRSPELEKKYRQRSPEVSERSYRQRNPEVERSRSQRSPEVERSRRQRSPEVSERSYRQRSPEVERKYRQRSTEVSERNYRQRSPEVEKKSSQRSPEVPERSFRQMSLEVSERKYHQRSPEISERNYHQRSPEVSERNYHQRSLEVSERNYHQRSSEVEKKYSQGSPEVPERNYRQRSPELFERTQQALDSMQYRQGLATSHNHSDFDQDKDPNKNGLVKNIPLNEVEAGLRSMLVKCLMRQAGYKVSILQLTENFNLKPNDVRMIVKSSPHVFNIEGEIVKLSPQLKLCSFHSSRSGCQNHYGCRDLHLCSRLIEGSCRDNNCFMGHHIATSHNMNILDSFGLSGIDRSIIFNLLKYFTCHSSHMDSTRHSGHTNKKQLGICNNYNYRRCYQEACIYLHICKSFLEGNFKCQRASCRLTHELLNPQCVAILQDYGIDVNESPRDVLNAICQANPYLLTMRKQISTTGDTRQDRNRDNADENRNNRIGNRNNARNMDDADPNWRDKRGSKDYKDRRDEKEDFSDAGSDKSEAKAKISYQSNRHSGSIWDYHLEGDTKIPEICFHSVEGKCRNEYDGCKRLHAKQHYHWQIKRMGTWYNLSKNQVLTLEQKYCDPDMDGVDLPVPRGKDIPEGLDAILDGEKWKADFETMKLEVAGNRTLKLRRIHSQPEPGKSVSGSSFQWYFLDQNKVWVKYGDVDTTKRDFLASNVTSTDIENQYQQNPDGSMTFKNSMFNYKLDFSSMTQKNLSTNVSRTVRRRPRPHLKASWLSAMNPFK